jgi:hypothetical protein
VNEGRRRCGIGCILKFILAYHTGNIEFRSTACKRPERSDFLSERRAVLRLPGSAPESRLLSMDVRTAFWSDVDGRAGSSL